MKVSVILPYFKKLEQFPYGLQSLERQTVRPDEVVLVNDGCGDIEPILKQTSLNYKYIRLENNKYRTSTFAFNEGIRQSSGDVIIMTSAEMVWSRFNIENFKNLINKKNVVIAKRMYFPGSKVDLPSRFKIFPDLIDNSNLNIKVWYSGMISKDNEIVYQDNCGLGWFGVYKSNLEALNGFNEEFPYYGCNDTSLMERFKLYGLRLERRPEIMALHLYHKRPPGKHMKKALEVRQASDSLARSEYRCKRGLLYE